MITLDLSDIANMISDNELEVDVIASLEDLTNAIFVDLTAPAPLGTPFDTGVARNGWQPDNSNPLSPEIYNMVPYIGALNNGHSKQSPAGFVDAILDKNQV